MTHPQNRDVPQVRLDDFSIDADQPNEVSPFGPSCCIIESKDDAVGMLDEGICSFERARIGGVRTLRRNDVIDAIGNVSGSDVWPEDQDPRINHT